MGGEVIVDLLESGLAVVVVGVDDGEGGIANGLPGADHRVAGAPGLGASFGDGVASGELVQLLIGIADLQGSLLQSGPYGLHEVLFNGFLDNDHGGVKAGLVGIEQGVVQDGLTLAAYGIDLLQSAIAAAHTRSHHNQNGFLHFLFLLLLCLFFYDLRHLIPVLLHFGDQLELGAGAVQIVVGIMDTEIVVAV